MANLLNKKLYLLPIVAIVVLIISCTTSSGEQEKTKAQKLIEEIVNNRDNKRLAHVADSLMITGELSKGESNFWQGFAYYWMKQNEVAKYHWETALKVTENSTDPNDVKFYARSASYMASLMCRFGDYALVLQTCMPAVTHLEQIKADTTSDYTNLLIFTGCCRAHFDIGDSSVVGMFEKAYEMHLRNIKDKGTKEAYRDAIAGLENIAYGWVSERNYQQGLRWSERVGKLVSDYRNLFPSDVDYIDKQWSRFKIYRAIILEIMGLHEEAARDYRDYQATNFSTTMEGLTNAAEYLTVAGRWEEAAKNFSIADDYLHREGAIYTMDNIQRYMLKKYQANKMLGNQDSLNSTARKICEELDSAIMVSRDIDAVGLEIIRQKGNEIVERQAQSARYKQINTIVLLVAVTIAFAVYTVIRHRAQRKLEEKNKQLTIANARAEESSKMKTNFIQQISHEIRTPLNILSGFTQILTTPGMELDADTQKDINGKIVENTDRITNLVNKMLELSDANSKAVIERTDDVPAVQVAAQAADASGVTTASHVTFDMKLSAEAEQAMMHTNLQQASRALALLLDNAQKFIKQPGDNSELEEQTGQVTLTVSTANDPATIVFTVEDTGIGVPAAEAEHIFEEFVQLDEFYDGTGIGLTVARSIARRLGGDIKLDTTCKRGARFVMTLPA